MLYDIREELATLLMDTLFINAYPEAPQTFSPPGVVVEQGNPYITTGETFGSLTVRYDVFLLVNTSPAGKKEVEELTGKALVALTGWTIENVQLDSFILTTNNRTLYGAQITISADVLIKELNN